MDKNNVLYLISTQNLGDFYVVGKDPTSATNILKKLLDDAAYGFSDGRKITNIKVLANEIHEFPTGKAHFSFKDSLIISSNWK